MITQEQFKVLLPLAAAWAEGQEKIILRDGSPLNESQIIDAQALKILYPEKIRLLRVSAIPLPADPSLKAAAQEIGLITPTTGGLTLRYGIYIRSDCWGDRRLIVHEMVHTSQYEGMGGFMPFLQRYLYECNTIGYPEAPMEQAAINTAAKLVG